MRRLGPAAAALVCAAAAAMTAFGGDAARGADPSLDERVEAEFARLLAPDAAARRSALDEFRKLGADAFPAVLRAAGREVGSPEWEAAVSALVAVDPAQALAEVECCRSQWKAFGWLDVPGGSRDGRRVVDALEERLLAARAAEWSKPVRLEPDLLKDAFRVPPCAEERVGDTLPSRLAWDDVPVREKDGKLEVDGRGRGRLPVRVDGARAAVVEVGPKTLPRRLLVYRRLGAWYAASPSVVRGVVEGTPVEVLDVEADGDFAGAADLVRFGDGAFRRLSESPLAWVGDALVRFRLRRDAEGFVLQTIPEPEPRWLDAAAAAGMAALQRWRAATGLVPVRVDRERSRACRLHQAYWSKNGFTAHDEDPARPGWTEDGALAGKSSSVQANGDGVRFVETITATVLHRGSAVGTGEEGVGFCAGGSGSLLWGGDVDVSRRGSPILSPAAGAAGVRCACEPEEPRPSALPDFYGTARGVPVSVTWSGITDAPLEGAVIEVFDEAAKKPAPCPGTTFSLASPYKEGFHSAFADGSVVFVADAPYRPETLHTARYRGRSPGGEVVEFTWQFRTR